MLVNTSDSKLYFYAYSESEDGGGNRLVAFYSCDAPEFYDSFYANAEGNGAEDDATAGFRKFVERAEKDGTARFRFEFMINGLGTMRIEDEKVTSTVHAAATRIEWSALCWSGDFRVSYRNAKQHWRRVLL